MTAPVEHDGAMTHAQAVRTYAPLVTNIAQGLRAKLPASVLFDDLYQDGMMGLLTAIDGFDSKRNTRFQTYAGPRIKGAMLDGLRQTDWVSRGVRRTQRTIEVAEEKLSQEFMRKPTESEMATELDTTVAQFQQLLRDAMGAYMEYLNDGAIEEYHRAKATFEMVEPDPMTDPVRQIERRQRNEMMMSALNDLDDRQKRFMYLYYQCDKNMKAISVEFDVTESRVCQIHAEVVTHLRVRLQDWGALDPHVKLQLQTRARDARRERKRLAGLDIPPRESHDE